MRGKDVENERLAKKAIGIKDFELLSTAGVLGNYEECELTYIYLVEKTTKKLYHYFAIISYEEFSEVDEAIIDKYITDTPIKITTQFSLGIVRKRFSLADSKGIFEQLCDGALNFQSIEFVLPNDIQLLPKTHIPSLWGQDSVMLNKVLKPNIWRDRYILEFAAMGNPMNEFFTDKELNKINSEIQKIITIDLSAVYDRIGSFIFQFPVTLISGDAIITKDWTKTKVSLKVHPSFKHADELVSTVETKLDDTVTGFQSYSGFFEFEELEIGDSNNLEFKVFNKKNGLIYMSSMANFIRSFNFNLGIGGQNSEPRIFIDSEGNRQEIPLTSYSSGGNTGKSAYYNTRTKKRIMHNENINKSGRFLNVHTGERIEALNFLKQQLNDKGPSCSEVWLWDPFLDYKDIIDLLYFIGISDVKMKCITSYKKYNTRLDDQKEYTPSKLLKLFLKSIINWRKTTDRYLKFKNDQRNGFLNNSTNLGINLDFRSVYKNHGFEFHDRFLFLIPKDADEMPTVFSLGTSVNGLGKSHHLIQQTLDPRNIIETFNELWDLLDNEESLIIKLPEEKHD